MTVTENIGKQPVGSSSIIPSAPQKTFDKPSSELKAFGKTN
jgi:hypothetical protein